MAIPRHPSHIRIPFSAPTETERRARREQPSTNQGELPASRVFSLVFRRPHVFGVLSPAHHVVLPSPTHLRQRRASSPATAQDRESRTAELPVNRRRRGRCSAAQGYPLNQTAPKSLSLDYCNVSNEAFTDLIIKLPLLEELLISLCPFVDGDAYEITSRACAQLKRLMLRQGSYGGEREGPLGIEFMHELRYLTLVGSDITTEELVAIIDGCPHLERLCVRNCCNIVVDGGLRAKCSRIKTLILPTLQCRHIHFHPDDGIFTDKFDDWRSA
nr:uncharacterized protein LOC127312607 [Lolium perenne]